MNPYKAKNLPFNYEIDKELLILSSEANSKYGEYKSALSTLELEASFFFEFIIINREL